MGDFRSQSNFLSLLWLFPCEGASCAEGGPGIRRGEGVAKEPVRKGLRSHRDKKRGMVVLIPEYCFQVLSAKQNEGRC